MTEVLGLKIQQWTTPHSNKNNNYIHKKKNKEEKALMKFALLHPLKHGEYKESCFPGLVDCGHSHLDKGSVY